MDQPQKSLDVTWDDVRKCPQAFWQRVTQMLSPYQWILLILGLTVLFGLKLMITHTSHTPSVVIEGSKVPEILKKAPQRSAHSNPATHVEAFCRKVFEWSHHSNLDLSIGIKTLCHLKAERQVWLQKP